MAIYKNIAGQKISVYAYDSTATASPKTGDAANITAEIAKDAGTSAATNDVNPTELDATDHPGVYVFDLTAAETNADMINLSAVSSTSNIVCDTLQILPLPMAHSATEEGACEATPSTTVIQTDLAEATDDHYNGRLFVLTSGSGAGQASEITDYTGSTGTVTINAIVTAPAAADTFVIV